MPVLEAVPDPGGIELLECTQDLFAYKFQESLEEHRVPPINLNMYKRILQGGP